MKIKTPLALFVLVYGLSLGALAESSTTDQQVLSRSIGKLVSDHSLVLSRQVKSQPTLTGKTIDAADATETRAADNSAGLIANRQDQLFTIYDADVALISDMDGDGFHHAMNVRFDVDVDYDGATVYAKLFLSREGRPWVQYHTTDLFNIFENDAADEYEVTTELVEGYATGYYAVLIEVYSLNHADMVTSEILDHHYLGKDIRLEDLDRDQADEYIEYEEYHEYGAGSFSIILWLLLVQVVIVARVFLRLSTRKREQVK